MTSAIGSLTASYRSPLQSFVSSKSLVATTVALLALSYLPTAEAKGKTYTDCFKACMDGLASNKIWVSTPICTLACLPALLF